MNTKKMRLALAKYSRLSRDWKVILVFSISDTLNFSDSDHKFCTLSRLTCLAPYELVALVAAGMSFQFRVASREDCVIGNLWSSLINVCRVGHRVPNLSLDLVSREH